MHWFKLLLKKCKEDFDRQLEGSLCSNAPMPENFVANNNNKNNDNLNNVTLSNRNHVDDSDGDNKDNNNRNNNDNNNKDDNNFISTLGSKLVWIFI
jgi:hypothetical protein